MHEPRIGRVQYDRSHSQWGGKLEEVLPDRWMRHDVLEDRLDGNIAKTFMKLMFDPQCMLEEPTGVAVGAPGVLADT